MRPEPQPLTDAVRRTQIGIGDCLISARAKELVLEVLDSGRLSAGPMMDRFEREVARLHGCRYGLMCNSGTSALHIALAALKELHGWRDGDEVLVPALTFVATSNVVLYNGLTPVFVDVEPDYYCIDTTRIEERITDRTRAIVAVHLAGLACDMDPIMELARKHRLHVVEDCAEAMTASYKGRPVGSFGDVACFSTYVAHVITTGVGGLCTSNDPELMQLLKSLMNHGRDSIYIRIDDDEGVEGEALYELADRRFSFVRLGHSFRATEMEAALGVAELEQLGLSSARRARVVRQLFEGLAPHETELQLPRPRDEAEHRYMFFPLVIRDPAVERHGLIAHLEARGIETRYLLPLINQPVYRDLFGDLDSAYPVAARLNERAFYIGCHAGMTDEDLEWVVASFHQYFSRTT